MDNVICSEVIKHFVDASEITKFLEHGRGNLTTLQYEEKLAQLRNKYTEREKFILNKTLTFTASIIDVDANTMVREEIKRPYRHNYLRIKVL